MSAENFCHSSKPFLIPGASGQLEVLTSCPTSAPVNKVAIICHPHPLYAGTMQNKVVHTLAKTFDQLGMHTIRFNFRGVGQSEGVYADGIGETDDVMAIANWVHNQLPDHGILLSGFSFGAYVALRAAQILTINQLVTIAPPVNIFDFDGLQAPAAPWLVVQASDDEIVDASAVHQWLAQFSAVECISLDQAGHFFHGQLNLLQRQITHYFAAKG